MARSPLGARSMNSSAWARAAASRISSRVASGLPMRRLSAIERLSSSASWNTTPILRRSADSFMSRTLTPSIITVPLCGSKARWRSASAVDLPAPVEPTSATISPGSAVNVRSATAGRLPSYDKVTSLNSTRPRSRRVDRVGPVANDDSVSRTLKNSRSRGASMNTLLMKRTNFSSWPISDAEKLMNITMSPIDAVHGNAG